MLAIWGGSFLEPDPLNYFFGQGIGTNIGSSIIWGFLAGLLGMFVARRVKAAWARMHAKLDEHHAAILAEHRHQSRLVEEMHHLAHTGQHHARVQARLAQGESATPTKGTP